MNEGLYILCWVCLAASIFMGLASTPISWAYAATFFFILMTWES